ncbi:carboxyltransferase domain-containing protein, partial [Mycobacterium tuberculosis]
MAHGLPTGLAGNTVLDYGDRALMVQCGSAAEVLAWTAALRSEPIAGVGDVVPAAGTVLVRLGGPRRQGGVRRGLHAGRGT